jgi:hypothetical protein
MELGEGVTDRTRDAGSVLVLRPRSKSETDAACRRLLAGDPEGVRLLSISFTRSPDRVVADWVDAVAGRLRETVVVTSANAGDGSTADVVETVPSPAALTNVGVKATPHLGRWADAGDVVVAVDSLTHLLRYVRLESLYRFLHTLTAHVDAIDARGQFYVDPTAHDESTLNALKGLFRAVVEHRTGDDWRVRTQ